MANYEELELGKDFPILSEDFEARVKRDSPPNYGVDVKTTHLPTGLSIVKMGTNAESVFKDSVKIIYTILRTGKLPIYKGITIDFTDIDKN